MGDFKKKEIKELKRFPANAVKKVDLVKKQSAPVMTHETFVHCANCVRAGKASNVLSVKYTTDAVIVNCLGCGFEVCRFQRK